MEVLFIFSLLSYGISNIIVFGSIFEGLRNFFDKKNPGFFGKLVKCMMCTSFWVGFFLSFVFITLNYTKILPLSYFNIDNLFISVFLHGVLSSGCVWLIHTFQEFLERAFNE